MGLGSMDKYEKAFGELQDPRPFCRLFALKKEE